jgi:hypothetical protein
MKTLKLFGIQFIIRVRDELSLWSFQRLAHSYRIDMGRLVIYKMDRNTFNNMNGIVDRKGQVTIA